MQNRECVLLLAGKNSYEMIENWFTGCEKMKLHVL